MTRITIALASLLLLTAPAHAANYVIIAEDAQVAATADAAWAKIGGFCGIADWTDFECAITAGDGGTGTVRLLDGEIEEVIVGSTATSHTYLQTVGSFVAAGYHGTVSVTPNADGTTSTLRWVGIYDEAALADDAARAATRERLTGFYKMGAAKMKTLAEAE